MSLFFIAASILVWYVWCVFQQLQAAYQGNMPVTVPVQQQQAYQQATPQQQQHAQQPTAATQQPAIPQTQQGAMATTNNLLPPQAHPQTSLSSRPASTGNNPNFSQPLNLGYTYHITCPDWKAEVMQSEAVSFDLGESHVVPFLLLTLKRPFTMEEVKQNQ